jgi:hypothetical protein
MLIATLVPPVPAPRIRKVFIDLAQRSWLSRIEHGLSKGASAAKVISKYGAQQIVGVDDTYVSQHVNHSLALALGAYHAAHA